MVINPLLTGMILQVEVFEVFFPIEMSLSNGQAWKKSTKTKQKKSDPKSCFRGLGQFNVKTWTCLIQKLWMFEG